MSAKERDKWHANTLEAHQRVVHFRSGLAIEKPTQKKKKAQKNPLASGFNWVFKRFPISRIFNKKT